jgi:hypothetical protein
MRRMSRFGACGSAPVRASRARAPVHHRVDLGRPGGRLLGAHVKARHRGQLLNVRRRRRVARGGGGGGQRARRAAWRGRAPRRRRAAAGCGCGACTRANTAQQQWAVRAGVDARTTGLGCGACHAPVQRCSAAGRRCASAPRMAPPSWGAEAGAQRVLVLHARGRRLTLHTLCRRDATRPPSSRARGAAPLPKTAQRGVRVTQHTAAAPLLLA